MENNPNKGSSGAGQKGGGLSWSSPPGGQRSGDSSSSNVQKPMPMPGSLPKSTPTQVKAEGAAPAGRRALVGAFVGGLVVGILAGWAWFGTQTIGTPTDQSDTGSGAVPGAAASGTTDTGSGATASGTMTDGGLLVPTQPAGLQVAISHASVTRPTWIVVYESRGGQPGNALGAGLFFASTPSGVVDLLRGTLPGQTYFVGESLDDGDRIFSLQNDKPLRDESGNPIWVTFTTQ